MRLYRLHRRQVLNISLEEAWDFFSSPNNLKHITPEYMGFDVTEQIADGQKMYAGMIISYIVKPLLNIPMTWVTEITHVEAPRYFVDEQRFGPYALWHHKHFFHALPDGRVEMEDLVHYALPMGVLGRLFGGPLVHGRVRGIFDYRFQVLEKMFNQNKKLSA